MESCLLPSSSKSHRSRLKQRDSRILHPHDSKKLNRKSVSFIGNSKRNRNVKNNKFDKSVGNGGLKIVQENNLKLSLKSEHNVESNTKIKRIEMIKNFVALKNGRNRMIYEDDVNNEANPASSNVNKTNFMRKGSFKNSMVDKKNYTNNVLAKADDNINTNKLNNIECNNRSINDSNSNDSVNIVNDVMSNNTDECGSFHNINVLCLGSFSR